MTASEQPRCANLVLDLFSGTGSATQPFVDCGKHKVVRVDIAGYPDVRADVARFHLSGPVQFIWASPPCQGFSVSRYPDALEGQSPGQGSSDVHSARASHLPFLGRTPGGRLDRREPNGVDAEVRPRSHRDRILLFVRRAPEEADGPLGESPIQSFSTVRSA